MCDTSNDSLFKMQFCGEKRAEIDQADETQNIFPIVPERLIAFVSPKYSILYGQLDTR